MLTKITNHSLTRIYTCILGQNKEDLPRTPAEGMCGEFEGEARGHLGLELGLETLCVGHDGLCVLLLLLHVHVHVPHGHLVAQARHPAVRVLPGRVLEREALRLPRRSRRLRRSRSGRDLEVGPPEEEAAATAAAEEWG